MNAPVLSHLIIDERISPSSKNLTMQHNTVRSHIIIYIPQTSHPHMRRFKPGAAKSSVKQVFRDNSPGSNQP